jgi:hypothetical protein
MIVTDGGTPRRIDVPVEVPEGVSREGVFGEAEWIGFFGRSPKNRVALAPAAALQTSVSETVNVTSSGSGSRPKRESRKKGSAGSGGAGGGGVAAGAGQGGNVGGGDGKSSGGVAGPANSPGTVATTVSISDHSRIAKLSPEEEKRQLLLAKFHPTVLAVVERLKNNSKQGADEVRFIRGEKAEVQIWLTEKSPEVLAKLKELGFEVVLDPKTAKLVIGRLPIANLQKLAELKFVRYVAPQMSS